MLKAFPFERCSSCSATITKWLASKIYIIIQTQSCWLMRDEAESYTGKQKMYKQCGAHHNYSPPPHITLGRCQGKRYALCVMPAVSVLHPLPYSSKALSGWLLSRQRPRVSHRSLPSQSPALLLPDSVLSSQFCKKFPSFIWQIAT